MLAVRRWRGQGSRRQRADNSGRRGVGRLLEHVFHFRPHRTKPGDRHSTSGLRLQSPSNASAVQHKGGAASKAELKSRAADVAKL